MRPDDEAVAFGDLRMTWSAWARRVEQATGALAAAGIGRGDRVAVIDRNHIASLDMILAAGALGAATVLPNWRLADAELAHVLADSGPRLVVLGAPFTDRTDVIRRASASIERIVHLDGEYESWLASAEPRGPSTTASADDIALVIYTSGTTGVAKGAMFSHRGLDANSVAAAHMGAMGTGDRVLVSMPLFHVGGAGAALSAVHEGVPITLLREPSAAAIVDALEAGCTRAFLVPAVISALLSAGQRERDALGSLSLLTYGGAPCPTPVLQEALRALPDTQFVQVYGMTELCGTVTTLTDLAHRESSHSERLRSVGQVIEGARVRIVDPDSLDDVNTGERGELWFRTAKRMVGYLGRPDATAEVIVEGDWVRTGDIGRMDVEGFVYIEDRLKDVIITGGENVYGPEVEEVLAGHPSVAEAAVIGLPDPGMGESVCAVVVAAPGAVFDSEALIAFTREHLARFKCPRSVVVVDALPRNAAGKVLKTELRARLGSRSREDD